MPSHLSGASYPDLVWFNDAYRTPQKKDERKQDWLEELNNLHKKHPDKVEAAHTGLSDMEDLPALPPVLLQSETTKPVLINASETVAADKSEAAELRLRGALDLFLAGDTCK